MKDAICPACGSKRLTKSNYQETISENLGGSSLINKILYHCEDCDFEGDLFNENDTIIEQTIQSLKNDLVKSILNDFSSKKISLSSIERALELPQRTLTKWKNGASSPTSAGITLLKFIMLFPWLLEVAENKFDYTTAQRIHLNVAWHKIVNHMTFREDDYWNNTPMATTNPRNVFFIINNDYGDIKNDFEIINVTPQQQRIAIPSTT